MSVLTKTLRVKGVQVLLCILVYDYINYKIIIHDRIGITPLKVLGTPYVPFYKSLVDQCN
jgi:hypothetical protein